MLSEAPGTGSATIRKSNAPSRNFDHPIHTMHSLARVTGNMACNFLGSSLSGRQFYVPASCQILGQSTALKHLHRLLSFNLSR